MPKHIFIPSSFDFHFHAIFCCSTIRSLKKFFSQILWKHMYISQPKIIEIKFCRVFPRHSISKQTIWPHFWSRSHKCAIKPLIKYHVMWVDKFQLVLGHQESKALFSETSYLILFNTWSRPHDHMMTWVQTPVWRSTFSYFKIREKCWSVMIPFECIPPQKAGIYFHTTNPVWNFASFC